MLSVLEKSFDYRFFLKVLAEREKRIGGESLNNSSDDLSEKNRTAQHLLEEIRQAVSEANAKGKLMSIGHTLLVA